MALIGQGVTPRRAYRSDVSDARWALIEPVFVAWRAARSRPGTAARVHDLREIVNAILYVNRTGIPWEYLPHDFPPFKTVYDWYRHITFTMLAHAFLAATADYLLVQAAFVPSRPGSTPRSPSASRRSSPATAQ